MQRLYIVYRKKMCNNCGTPLTKALEKYVDNFDDPKVEGLYEDLQWVLTLYHNNVLQEVLKQYETQTELAKTETQDSFFDAIAELLESIYLYWQWIGMKLVKDETKELEAIASLDFNLSFNIEPIRAKEYAQFQAWALIKNIDDATQSEVQTIVTQSINEWRTQKKLAQEIDKKFSQYNSWRSKLIARQETSLALWGWKYKQFTESAKAYNTPWYKKAYTQQDEKVRPEHTDNAEAWRIQANEEFPWTWWMHEPFWYNCRCVVTYRVFLPDSL